MDVWDLIPIISVFIAVSIFIAAVYSFLFMPKAKIEISPSYPRSQATEPGQQNKDDLSEQMEEKPMDISELTPDEIELIKRKRAAESGNSTPGHQERSFDLAGRKLHVINESFVDVVIQHSDRSYIEVEAENEEACKLITTDLQDANTIRVGVVSSSVGKYSSNNGSFVTQGNNASISIGNGSIKVGTNNGVVASQIFHGNVIGGISFGNSMVFRQAPKVTIHVPRTLTEIDLTQKGSGSITTSNEAVDDGASVSLSLSGSGDITISGKCENLTAQLSGSGDIKAKGLVAVNCVANLVGSGDIVCNVTGSINANLVGSGDIKVFGSPAKKHLNKVGSGRISEF